MTDDFDTVRFHQAQNGRHRPERIERHREGEPSGPGRNGARIAIVVLAVIVTIWLAMVLLDPGGSEAWIQRQLSDRPMS
jgi:hypothetical protein